MVEQPIRNPAVDITVIWNQRFRFGLFGSIWVIRGDMDGFRYSLCTGAQPPSDFNFITQHGQKYVRGGVTRHSETDPTGPRYFRTIPRRTLTR